MEILYLDTALAVLVKDPGTESESISSLTVFPEEPEGELFCVHRLDRNTGGVMVFARTKAAAAALSAAFAEGRVKKTYLALAEGLFPEKTGMLEDLLFHDRTSNKTFIVKRERRGVRKASLSYAVLAESVSAGPVPLSLLQVRLHTGRTHQIRIQFASRKHPLAGDRRYGSRSSFDGLGLWCFELSFPHPVTGEALRFSADPGFLPEEFRKKRSDLLRISGDIPKRTL